MTKASAKQNITISRKISKTQQAINEKFWSAWEHSLPDTYLEVPHKVRRFSKFDPRKHEWRKLTRD